MTRDSATIIPFPIQNRSAPKPSGRSKWLAMLQDNEASSEASRSQAIPNVLAMFAAQPDWMSEPAFVARVVIRHARMKGVAMSSVPKLIRDQLRSLCAAGDPTALTLRNWLEGNRALFAAAAETGEGA